MSLFSENIHCRLHSGTKDLHDISESGIKELDLESPIFVFYISTDGLGRQKADELIRRYVDITTYSNITTWYIATRGENNVEVIWKGKSIESQANYERLLKNFEEISTMVSEDKSSEEIKQKMRSMQLDYILEEK